MGKRWTESAGRLTVGHPSVCGFAYAPFQSRFDLPLDNSNLGVGQGTDGWWTLAGEDNVLSPMEMEQRQCLLTSRKHMRDAGG